MALAQTIKHRFTQEQITFLQSASETAGQLLHIEVKLPPHGDGPPLHVHDSFEEAFEVVEGKLTVFVADRKLVLESGQTIVAPIGCAHTFTNDHDEPVTFRVRLTPASQFEQSARIHYGLMDDGLTDDKGTPKNILHLAYILQLQNTYVAEKSIKIQRAIFSLLVKLGHLTKSYKNFEKYYK